MTKATDLITIFFKGPWKMHVETCIKMIFVFKKKFVLTFLTLYRHFSLPCTQTIKVIGLIFFLWAGLEKLCNENAFQPYIYSLRSFPGEGVRRPPPGFRFRFRPPSLYKGNSNRLSGLKLYKQNQWEFCNYFLKTKANNKCYIVIKCSCKMYRKA